MSIFPPKAAGLGLGCDSGLLPPRRISHGSLIVSRPRGDRIWNAVYPLYSLPIWSGTAASWVMTRKRHLVILRLVAGDGGRVVGSAGDSVIAEVASPVEAVRCARGGDGGMQGILGSTQ